MAPHNPSSEYAGSQRGPLRLFRQPQVALLMLVLIGYLALPRSSGAISDHQSGEAPAGQPSSPRFAMAQLAQTGGAVMGVTVHETTAMLTTWSREQFTPPLRFIDTADHAHPVEAGIWKLSITALAVSGDYAYAIDSLYKPHSTLWIFGLHDGAHPLLVARYDLDRIASDIAISGPIAYLPTYGVYGGDELLLLDISDPLQPRPRGHVTVQDLPYWVAVSGTVAYTIGSAGTVALVNVTDPDHPTLQSMFTPSHGSITDVAVVGAYAVMANADGGHLLVDVSNPSAPIEVGSVNVPSAPGPATRVVAIGTTAYVAARTGLHAIDISDPYHPLLRWTLPIASDDVQVVGDRIYIAAGGAGLQVLQLSPVSAPTPLGEYVLPSDARDVQVVDQIAYVADGDNRQLMVLDIHDRTHPLPLSRTPLPGPALGVTISDGRAYVSMGSAGLEILDVAEPRQPQRLGHYDAGNDVVDAQVVGSTAYVAASRGGWRILDVTTPQAPVVLFGDNAEPDSGIIASVTAIWATDGLVYTTGLSGEYIPEVRVFDVTNPSMPHLLGNYRPSAPVSEIGSIVVIGTSAVIGGTLLRPVGRWAQQTGFVELLDLTNPQSPVVQASFVDEASTRMDIQDTDRGRVLISHRYGDDDNTSIFDINVPGNLSPLLRPLTSTQSCPDTHLDLQDAYIYSAGGDLCIFELRPLLPKAYLPLIHQ